MIIISIISNLTIHINIKWIVQKYFKQMWTHNGSLWYTAIYDGTIIRHHAISWTDTDLLSIGPLRTNFSKIQFKMNFSFMKMHLESSSAKWRPFCPGGDELTRDDCPTPNHPDNGRQAPWSTWLRTVIMWHITLITIYHQTSNIRSPNPIT